MLWTKPEKGNREQQPLEATEPYWKRARPSAEAEVSSPHETREGTPLPLRVSPLRLAPGPEKGQNVARKLVTEKLGRAGSLTRSPSIHPSAWKVGGSAKFLGAECFVWGRGKLCGRPTG